MLLTLQNLLMERSMELRLARQREEKEREWREKQIEQAKKSKDRIRMVRILYYACCFEAGI